MEENQNCFTMRDANGKETKYEVILTFDSDETKKSYIVYTDNTVDTNGNTRTYASIFDPKKDVQQFQPIETEDEWKMVELALEQATGGHNEQ